MLRHAEHARGKMRPRAHEFVEVELKASLKADFLSLGLRHERGPKNFRELAALVVFCLEACLCRELFISY